MPIDWDATGSMLQGWATLVGAGAVIYAAKVGSNTFGAWKRQKQEERRMDAAERILTLAYRLRHNLEAIRNSGIFSGEVERAETALKAADDRLWTNLDVDRQRKATTAQVIRQRLSHFQNEIQEVWSLKPMARAFFGPEVEERLHDLWDCHVRVSSAADDYPDAGNDNEFTKEVKRDLFRSGQPNPINDTVATAITALELELLPVIRSDFRPGWRNS